MLTLPRFNPTLQNMTDDRKSALALIVGMTGSIITMAFHPSGAMSAEQFDAVARLNVAVHALALVCTPIIFLGTLGLTQRLGARDRLALAALVFFGFADVAIMIAATASGLLMTGLMQHAHSATTSTVDSYRVALQLVGHINQSFALIFVIASSIAIVLWSAAILKGITFARSLGTYGCILGPITVLAVLSGHIRFNVHGFGAIVLGQAAWFIIAGVQLWRTNQTEQAALPA
jgi:hypothetical protein